MSDMFFAMYRAIWILFSTRPLSEVYTRRWFLILVASVVVPNFWIMCRTASEVMARAPPNARHLFRNLLPLPNGGALTGKDLEAGFELGLPLLAPGDSHGMAESQCAHRTPGKGNEAPELASPSCRPLAVTHQDRGHKHDVAGPDSVDDWFIEFFLLIANWLAVRPSFCVATCASIHCEPCIAICTSPRFQ